jgi:hypothetical protein
MKLRLQPKEIRFRLSAEEVARLASKCALTEEIAMGDVLFSYGLAVDAEAETVNASFDGQQVLAILPAPIVKQWAASEQEGIEVAQDGLRIVIEKDRGACR